MYRFLLSWRWLGAFVLTLAVAAGCVLLGQWQWDRREQRLERNALITDNYDRPPVPLSEVLDRRDELPRGTEWTPVQVSGTYLPDDQLLLRNRPLAGQPGYHVLVPFASDDGDVLLVDRGWLPIGQTGEAPDAVPAPPDGQVRVVVRLRPAEPASDRGSPPGQVQSIRPATAPLPGVDRGALVTAAYGVLAQETPAPRSAPQPLPKPELDEGPHLSYSMQWFVFALGAFVAFVVLIRRTAQHDEDETVRPVRVRRPTAEQEEDALVDAQLRQAGPTTNREEADGSAAG